MLSGAIAKSKHLPEGDDMQRSLYSAVNADVHKERFYKKALFFWGGGITTLLRYYSANFLPNKPIGARTCLGAALLALFNVLALVPLTTELVAWSTV